MEDNDNLAFKERSLDELIGHLTSDVQGDGQFGSHMRYPQPGGGGLGPGVQRFGPDPYPSENGDAAFMPRRNVYFQEAACQRDPVPMPPQQQQQPPQQPQPQPPYMLGPAPGRDDLVPGMVDMRGGDYVIFGNSHTQKSANGPNLNFINKTNGTLTGFNDYGMEYPTTGGQDYNLFSRLSPQRHSSVPQFSHGPETNAKVQLIENLVGNWTSDQSGTYSPFGTSLGGLRSDIIDNISLGRGNRKTRIVAEVRPMRPSYSDVLAKSIANNSNKPSPKTPTIQQETKQKSLADVKVKAPKFSVGRTLSGNANLINRQTPPVSDESNYVTSTNQKGSHGRKSEGSADGQESLSKKWSSLDDVKNASKRDSCIHLAEVNKNKKNSPKNAGGVAAATAAAAAGAGSAPGPAASAKSAGSGQHPTSQSRRDKWEPAVGPGGNVKAVNGKSQVPRKQDKAQVKVQQQQQHQAEAREKDYVSGSKYGILRDNAPEENKVSWPTRKPKAEGQKSTKRTVRNCLPEKHRKAVRTKRREQDPCLSAIIKVRMDRYGGVLLFALNWLLQLVLDVLGLSTHLAIHMCAAIWASSMLNATHFYKQFCRSVSNIELVKRIVNSRFYPFRKSDAKSKKQFDSDDDGDESGEAKVKRKVPRGLKHNITLPVTGEEAMKRLLACKGKDPYSILGVTQDCTDDDIKKYYKRQAFLVHPDKNNQPGAEEAFKILVHAFDIIGEPEHRKSYDRRVEKTQFEQATWSELSDLLSQLHKKMEYVANTIRCTNCNKRHKRTTVDRPIYAARMCNQCKIHHSVREGDIWAETSMFGLLWHYYACMDGAVYDITEWAGCQGSNLRNIKANTHNVQYRIVLGKQHGQKQNYQQPAPASEPDFDDFISNFYTKSDPRGGGKEADKTCSSGKKRKAKKKK